MTVPSLIENFGLDTSASMTPGKHNGSDLLDRGGEIDDGDGDEDREDEDDGLADIPDSTFLQLARQGEDMSIQYLNSTVRPKWIRAIKATHNEHADGSKYGSPAYRNRSKMFRPKSLIAQKKSMVNAAKALFSTGDVVGVSAINEADPYHEASAKLKQELLNYRLSRTSRRNGIRWTQIALGGIRTIDTQGLVVSKQTWRYREELGYDPVTQGLKTMVMMDRPSVELIAPENALFDFNCDWTDPAQTSPYFILRYPMSPEDAFDMISKKNSLVPWREEVDLAMLRAGGSAPAETTGIRAARHGVDTQTLSNQTYKMIWVREVFMRFKGRDYVFWTLDNQKMLSDPISVSEAYPHLYGERPLVVGFGTIEPFTSYPQSKIDSIQPLQMEANDQVNLRLDHFKQIISPPAVVRRGRNVDLGAVQKRAPNSIILATDPTDVTWAAIPDVPQSAFVETNYVNADIDALVGAFDTGSVQTNRALNETVGGMRLLSGSADQMSEFDLTIAVETWVEPVVWQLLKLEEFYESDAVVLAIAGEKAKLYEKFGMSEVTDEILRHECSLTVKVGVGVSTLPQDRLQKLTMATQASMNILMPFVQNKLVKPPIPKMRELINEIFGDAGFRDGGDRFFFIPEDNDLPPPSPPMPNPDKQAEQQTRLQIAQMDAQGKAQALAQKGQETTAKVHIEAAKLIDNEHERVARVNTEHIKALAEISAAFQRHSSELSQMHAAQGHEHIRDALGRAHEQSLAALDRASSEAKVKMQVAARGQQQGDGE